MQRNVYIIVFGVMSLTIAANGGVEHQSKKREFIFKKGEQKECPHLCHCLTPEHVDCSEAQLQFVPRNISGKAVYLILNKNKLESLSSECFTDCPLVQTLDLEWNMLSEEGLPPTTFAPLNNLHHLILSNNRLKKLPAGLPDSLVTLHLAGNEIKRIDPAALALKTQLRNLYLHNNCLTDDGISKGIFRTLRRLEEMTLSSNNMTRIPAIPSSAEEVYLQNNSMQRVTPGVFRRKRNIRVLFLQHNNISNDGINQESFLGLHGIEYLDLSENSLCQMPEYLPRNVNRLHLERNQIKKISTNATKRLKKLEYLLLHQNNLGPSSIERGALGKLRKLHTLHIFGNHLTEIPEPLPKRLNTLIVLNNKISLISSNVFRRAKHLQNLNLRYNKLSNKGIARGALRQLKAADRIDLSGNLLRSVPGLPRNVTTLLLNRNRIRRIPARGFMRTQHLRQLGLADNRIRSEGIPLTAFKSNAAIQVLDLSSNELVRVPRLLPPNVEFLYLQNNKISEIPKNAFHSSPKLKGIFLQDNRLLPETVFRAAFSSLRWLHRLEISWRRLEPHELNAETINRRRKRHTLSLQESVSRKYHRRKVPVRLI